MKIKDNKEIIIGFITFFLGIAMIIHDCSSHPKKEFDPKKTFVVDKTDTEYRAFRPAIIARFCPNHFFHYVEDANKIDTINERRIIVRREKDGFFFSAKLNNPFLTLRRGQLIKLRLVQYWRSQSISDAYLIADPYVSQ